MILEELQQASFRGAVFFLTESSITSGRKDAKKELVNSDRQVIEDLGLRQPEFSLTGIVAESVTLGLSYKEMRDTLLDALQSGAGPGQLVHPFYGTIDNVVCRSFTINESVRNVGTASLTMNFEISNALGVPEEQATVLGTIATKASGTSQSLETEVGSKWNVSPSFAGNFADATQKVQDFVDSITAVTDKFPLAAAAELNSFATQLSDMSADATSLVTTPQTLATSVRNVIESLNGLLQTTPAVFNALVDLFDFGDLDIRFTETTAGRDERQKNRDAINSQVQGQALAQAYVFAAQLDLPTVDDIDQTQALLEAQFQKIATAGAIDRDSFDRLSETRIALSNFFNAQRATKPRRVQVEVHPIPARVLAFSYYGSSDLGDTIAELNGFRDAAFVEGTIEILSS